MITLSRSGRSAVAQLAGALRPATPAIVGYLAVQVLGLAVLALLSGRTGMATTDLLGHWDAQWYLEVAVHGYRQHVTVLGNGVPGQNSLVFFPLYPALIASVMALGPSAWWAAMIVTTLAGVAAAWGLFTLGRELSGPRTGTVLALLVAGGPGSAALHMAYSESLFVAVVAWSLVKLLQRRWLPAAGFAVLAGLTRATAVALIVALAVGAVIAVVRRQDGWRPWVAALLAPVGLAGHLVFVALRTDRLDGWYWLEDDAWKMRFDWGGFTLGRIVDGLTSNRSVWVTLTALVIIGMLVLLVWSYLERLPLFLHVYSTLLLVPTLMSSNFLQSRARFMLPAVTVLIPLAMLLARLPTRVLVLLLTVGALLGSWYGAFLMTSAHMNP
ncbi:MAG TPA: glycosyltransferase family 39 protein [Amycolatopsis sp.]|nr:glycosyltransferase family 39 protein [Amycolatopsis sp.]